MVYGLRVLFMGVDDQMTYTQANDTAAQRLLSNPQQRRHQLVSPTKKNNIYKFITLSPKDY